LPHCSAAPRHLHSFPTRRSSDLGILGSYHYNQTLSQQTLPPEPMGKPPRLDEARALVRRAQSERRRSLDSNECRELLDYFHVPLQYLDPSQTSVHPQEESPPMAIRVQRDAKFGPYIMFGSGGQDALIADTYRAVELPPLNSYLARKLVLRSTLWHRVLSRQMTPAAFENLQEALERISQLISELPGLETL